MMEITFHIIRSLLIMFHVVLECINCPKHENLDKLFIITLMFIVWIYITRFICSFAKRFIKIKTNSSLLITLIFISGNLLCYGSCYFGISDVRYNWVIIIFNTFCLVFA